MCPCHAGLCCPGLSPLLRLQVVEETHWGSTQPRALPPRLSFLTTGHWPTVGSEAGADLPRATSRHGDDCVKTIRLLAGCYWAGTQGKSPNCFHLMV